MDQSTQFSSSSSSSSLPPESCLRDPPSLSLLPFCENFRGMKLGSGATASMGWEYDDSLYTFTLDLSAQSFLEALNLPSIHPHCTRGTFQRTATANHRNRLNSTITPPRPPPPMGSLDKLNVFNDSIWSIMLTGYHMTVPALCAMIELWLRLFSFVLAPLSILYLLWHECKDSTSLLERWTSFGCQSNKKEEKKGTARFSAKRKNNTKTSNQYRYLYYSCVLGMSSSLILLTDSLYVHEYGRSRGGIYFIICLTLATRCCKRHRLIKTLRYGVIPIFILTGFLLLNSSGEFFHTFMSYDDGYPHPGIDVPTIREGLYYSSENTFITKVAASWPEHTRTYSISNGATPWLPTGDSRTGIPFIINKVEEPHYVRVWATNPNDDESVALDIAFSPVTEMTNGDSMANDDKSTFKSVLQHRTDRPVYLVLHGLNGGSHEEYVKDFVQRRINEEGSTVIIMIARGLMDTPVTGWNVFHGARVTDVDVAAKAIREALLKLSLSSKQQQQQPRQMLAGVGYSMGAIVLSNYVSRSGSSCHLDAAMAVSGGLDLREQLNFFRSMRLWQPMLAQGLRQDILLGKFAKHYLERLTNEEFVHLLRATSISEIDVHGVVTYNSFNDLPHYYSEMSAMGDTPSIIVEEARRRQWNLNMVNSLFGSGKQNGETVDATAASEGRKESQDKTCGNNGKENFNDKTLGRIANVSVPFCVLHALDDPLVTWRTIVPSTSTSGSGSGSIDPQHLVDSGSGHVMLLLTKSGGHVGWPLGTINPAKKGWKWMNSAVKDFVHAVDVVRKR